MKREFNSIIVDKKIIRHLPKDNSFNTGKIKKLYSNNLGMKPSNYFLSSYKNINLKDKDKNKDNYKNFKKRHYSIKNPKVNSTLNDLYDTINNINHINRKIQKILYSPETKYILNNAHTINKQSSDIEKTNNDSEKNMIDTHLNLGRNKDLRNKIINELKFKENDSISKSFRRNTNRSFFNKINSYTYQSRKKYSNGGINAYNNATINDNENKYNTLISFRRPKFKTISKQTSYIKEYKKNNLLRKDINKNEIDDNYLSDYESIVSSFNDQNSNNDDNYNDNNLFNINNNKKYYSHYDREQGRNNDNIKNMKLEINDINRINKLNEEQNQLNYIINQIDQNSIFNTTESKINSDISERTKNFKDIIFLEKYKQIELDKLNYMYDMKINNNNDNSSSDSNSNNSNNDIKYSRNSHIYSQSNNYKKYESEINNYNYNNKYENKYNNVDDIREKEKYMNYNNNNDDSFNENNINQFYINLKLNGNNNRNKLFHRNSANYDFNKYFKINEDSKINNDKYIYKVKEKDNTNQHEIYDYRNKKNNIFRNGSRNWIRNRNSSLNTDLNNKNKEKIIDNLKNIKFKKYMLENIIPLNNGKRFGNDKKDIVKYSINNYYKSDYNFNYNYSNNSITSRKNMQNKYI